MLRAMQFTTASLPGDVVTIARELRRAGFDAWVVGGCVRDALLDRPSGDWDLATSATPDDVMRVFRRTIPTGIKHGTVTVMMRGERYEVTTLRGESAYTDGRHPDAVHFVSSIEEDLARRDFTVNAIAYDIARDALVDPFDGRGDLERRIIRAVRDPHERFAEDGLRALRAARFVASLEFELDASTEAAIAGALETYAKVSHERVRDEWMKALRAPRPSRAFDVMRRTGMLAIHAPLLAALPADVFAETMTRVDAVPRQPTVARVAMLTSRLAAPDAAIDAWLRDLRFSNDEREVVSVLRRVRAAFARGEVHTAPSARRLLAEVGRGHWSWLEPLLASDPTTPAEAGALLRAVVHDPFTQRDLLVTGADIIRLSGRGPGRYVGEVLKALLDEVIEDPSRNQVDALVERARAVLAAS